MGLFKVPVEVGDPDGTRWEAVEMWVDSGSFYSWAPRDVLTRLGVRPVEQRDFEMADGSLTRREVGETWVRYGDRRCHTFVVYGDEGSESLLGAYTLEGLFLGVDPVDRQLVPLPFAMAPGNRPARPTEQ